jgi:hypothetical protein
MRRLLRRAAVVVTAASAIGAVAAAPAWASGGGCKQLSNTTPCISTGRIGDYVYGDFYQNDPVDSSRKYYRIEIWHGRTNQPWKLCNSRNGTLTSTGHYPQLSCGVAALPSVSEHAFTRVIVYTSAHVEHYRVDSPYSYYAT